MKVAVLGGGCVGLGVARELAGLGCRVTVHEKNPSFGAEASRAAAGMIGPQSEAMDDDACFAATLASRDLWPDYALALQKESGVDLGFHTQGALHLAFGAGYEKRLEAKYGWQKKKAGSLERLEGQALRDRYPFLHPRASSAFVVGGDYWVDNESLMDALEAACRGRGVELRASATVDADGLEVLGRENDAIVLASGAWTGQIFPKLEGLRPVKGQMLSFKVPAALMPDKPIHAEFVYLVPRGADRLLVGATVEDAGFDKRLTGEGIEWLLQNAFETMPDLRGCEVDRIWAGLRPASADGWPILGPSPEKGVFMATGHYRRGILLLPLTVKALVHSVMQGGLPDEAKVFAFERSPLNRA